MCGLVGVASLDGQPLKNDYVKIFKQLLYLDVVRGDHSTGICKVDKDFKTFVHKNVGPPNKVDTFTNNSVFLNNGTCNDAVVLIGHNRYATQGGINLKNAHPFITNNKSIIGAHNGTISKWVLDRIGKNPYNTDSEFIFNCIETKGLKDTIKEVQWGAYALTWWDTRDNSLNFLRNSERPLHVCRVDNVLVWASEDWMLDVSFSRVLGKTNVIAAYTTHKHSKYTIKDLSGPVVEEVKPEVKVYTFPNQQYLGPTRKPLRKDSIVNKDLVLVPSKIVDGSPKYLSMSIREKPLNFEGPYKDVEIRAYLNGKGSSVELLLELAGEPKAQDGGDFFIVGQVRHVKYSDKTGTSYHGVLDLRSFNSIQYYTQPAEEVDEDKSEWYKKTSSGCCHCSGMLPYEDKDKVVFVDNVTYFCAECVNANIPQDYGLFQTHYW